MSAKLQKIGRVIPAHESIKRPLNPIIHNLNRGHIVNSEHVYAKLLPDGRFQLFLQPEIRALFK